MTRPPLFCRWRGRLPCTALESFEPRAFLSTALGLSPLPVFGVEALGHKHLVDVVTMDLNDDGLPDIVATTPQTIYTAINNGDRTFGSIQSYRQGRRIDRLLVGDFNADGFDDLALARNKGAIATLRLVLGRGDGTLGAAAEMVIEPTSFLYAVLDVDGNPGDELIAVRYEPVSQASTLDQYTVANGMFTLAASAPGPVGPIFSESGEVTVPQLPEADVTGDGRADLVMRTQPTHGVPPTLTVLAGGGWTPGAQPRLPQYTLDRPITAFTVGDVDDDDLADLVFSEASGRSFNILTAKGRGLAGPGGSLLFDAPVTIGTLAPDESDTSFGLTRISVVDANSDGHVDVVVDTSETFYPDYFSRPFAKATRTQLLSPFGPSDQAPGPASGIGGADWIDLDNDGLLDAFGADREDLVYYPYLSESYVGDAVVQWSDSANHSPTVTSSLIQQFTAYDATGELRLSFFATDQDAMRPPADHLALGRAEFFADTNHNGRFDAKDQLIGQDIDSSDGFSLSLNPLQPWAQRRTLVFARAVDQAGATSDVISTTYTNPQPTAAFWYYPVFSPDHVGLRVVTSSPGATIQGVEFSLDSNRNNQWDPDDRVLGADTDGADGWMIDIPVEERWACTPKRIFAISWDELGRHSIPATTMYANPNPTIKSISLADPQPMLAIDRSIRLRVNGLLDPDAQTTGDYITSVKYYIDTDHDGAITSADLFLGRGRRPSQGYLLDATIARTWLNGRRRGAATILAVATDSNGYTNLQPAALTLNIGTA